VSRIVRVGLVDSGAPPVQCVAIEATAAFVIKEGRPERLDAAPDALGHGGAVLAIVRHLAPMARLCIAQVFRERYIATAAQVAAAIDWLAEADADIINLSLGLREDRAVLREACRRALEAGIVLCAAAPARGAAVFPAAYEGVWRMTGDACCGRTELTCLMNGQADFGAHVRPLPGGNARTSGGASMGCAHMSGHIAALLARDDAPARDDPDARRAWLLRQLRQQAILRVRN
jgi:hypothetical protein